MDSLVAEANEVGRLRAEAANLREWVEAARLLRSADPDTWRRLPHEVIQHFLVVVLTWVQVEGPESVWKASSLLKFTPIRLSQLLQWT